MMSHWWLTGFVLWVAFVCLTLMFLKGASCEDSR